MLLSKIFLNNLNSYSSYLTNQINQFNPGNEMYKLLLILLLVSTSVKSQEVIFCERVDKFGNAWNRSQEFKVSEKGGFLKILVKLNKKVESKSVIFDIYKVTGEKNVLENTIHMDVNPNLTWFYKEFTFYKEGSYEVYVYDEKDKLLGVGKMKIKLK
jgi:hypothetical protein